MNSKGAISLSINMLVIIIISLVIFGGGITLLYKLIGAAEEKKAQLDAQTQAQLERLLIDQGKKVALPRNTAYLYPGDFHSFGLGILNIDESDFGKQFTIDVQLSKALDEEENKIEPQPDVSAWLLFEPGPYTIKENEHESIPIGLVVPKKALKGTYIFNAWVTCTGTGKCDPYDTIKKFTVTVK